MPTTTTVEALTGAFDPSVLLTQFVALAPFIIGVIGTLLAVSIVSWAIKKVSNKLKKGV